MDKYQITLTLKEWQMFQRLRQLIKTYETGMMLIEWAQGKLTWRVVGKKEPGEEM